jgi:hypothetical protein
MRRRLALLFIPLFALLGLAVVPAKASTPPPTKVNVNQPVLCVFQTRMNSGLCLYSLF